MHSPNSFEINGRQISVSSTTNYGFLGKQPIQTGDGALHDAILLGAFVRVVGVANKPTKEIVATSILLRDDWDRKLSGLGVIDKVISAGPEPVFRADGYLLRITSATDLTFVDKLDSLADISTNIWVHYEGARDESGVVVVSRATFLPAKPSKFIFVPVLESTPITVELPHTAQSQKSTHKEKLRYSQSESRFKAIDDPALQERISRIGVSVVPAYQKVLPDDHPSKTHFRFYAVDNDKLRGEVCSFEGLILLPRTVIERLRSDDQLAAVLADGVAANLQRQAVRLTNANRAVLGAEAVGDVAGIFVPGVFIGAWIGSDIAESRLLIAMQKQRGRIALAMLNDAGYDLTQAPEAWRLLAPKTLPSNPNSLKYPDQSVYLLSMINQQYRRNASQTDAVSERR